MLTGGSVRRRTVAAALTAAVTLTGCDGLDRGGADIGEPDAAPRTLTVSTAWLQANSDDGQAQLARLRAAIDDLRGQTDSGWTGRQDDLTGYLAELTGGRWFPTTTGDAETPEGAATSLMDTWGEQLFGVTAADLALEPTTPALDNDTAALRASQQVAGVPVLDASLVFTIGASTTDPRVNAVRGRVHADLDLDTRPALGARKARKAAVAYAGGGSVPRDPRLVVLPTGTGRLAWEVPVAGVVQQAGTSSVAGSMLYVSAETGRVLDQRPVSAELAPLGAATRGLSGPRVKVRPLRLPTRAVAAESAVPVSGTGPTGEPLTGFGVRTPEGVLLRDTTVPGGIEVFDMRGSQDDSQLPGVPYVEGGTTVSDPDAIAAQAYTRIVRDYFLDVHGRASWDGQDHPMTSSIHLGDGSVCNAFFTSLFAQMIYANPCEGPGGLGQLVTLDVTGHEVTHGVVETTSGLVYFGQAGALNESLSDYFGNVIGDLRAGRDSAYLGEDLCSGVTQPQHLCDTMPDGTLALRDLLNGTTFGDYLKTLSPSPHLQVLTGYDTDNGGVHINSAIFNNALWSIRTQAANLDSLPAFESPRAATVDRAVFVATTTLLTPQAGFLEARHAVIDALTGLEAGAELVRIATETFDRAGICTGCAESVATPGVGLDAQPGRQVAPGVSGDLVTWLDIDDAGMRGTVTSAQADGSGRDAGAAASAQASAPAGEAIIVVDAEVGQVLRYAAGGVTVLDPDVNAFDVAARGLAGGDDGAAWVSVGSDRLMHVDAEGTVSSTPLSGLGGEVYSLGTGDGSVVVGLEDGRLLRWAPGSAPVEFGRVPALPLAVAAHGQRTLVVTEAREAHLFVGDEGRRLSDSAAPFGAALSADHAVWAEAVGVLGGDIARGLTGSGLEIDTDLFGYSFESGTIYDLLPLAGQQGYPALSGRRLVWQDSLLGGDHVYTALLPEGL